jgi:UDP-N-acetylglucosamine acyltransferase
LIHPSAQIDSGARLAQGVQIGPWVSIGPGVEIGAGTVIESHCVIRGQTFIGSDNHIFPFCSIGGDPQDKKFELGKESKLEIGNGNVIREYCSINRGTDGGGGVTILGDENWIMSYCHVAHDCKIGSKTTFANNATLAGHVEIDDYCTLGGFTGVHQFCRMGQSSFSAIGTIVVRDVPPFIMVDGNTAVPRSINREGLKRRGFSADEIAAIKRCYRLLYRSGKKLEEALAELKAEARQCERVGELLTFIQHSSRGIVR